MALYETVGSLIIILLALGVIVLISVMIRKLRREKSGLESLQAANNRKVLIKLNSACTIIDRFIQKSPDPAQLMRAAFQYRRGLCNRAGGKDNRCG